MKKLGGFREAFKNVKHRKPSKIFCPKCASPKIHLSSSLDLWLTPQSYVCEECRYTGLIIMELEKEDSQSTKENKEA
jgi:hypothetical protein